MNKVKGFLSQSTHGKVMSGSSMLLLRWMVLRREVQPMHRYDGINGTGEREKMDA